MSTNGAELTVVFPCGHYFGDRFVGDMLLAEENLTCPDCGFQMRYTDCGHAIPPAFIRPEDEDADGCVRDMFPLTIPEGGKRPSHCKECRWEAIQVRLRYGLNANCVLCNERVKAGIQSKDGDEHEHEAHSAYHVQHGIKRSLGEIMMLVQPDFVTRETAESARKTAEETNRRDVHLALLHAMVLTELEGTVWSATPTRQLSKKQAKAHAAGVRAVEGYVLDLLMDSRRNCRRMW